MVFEILLYPSYCILAALAFFDEKLDVVFYLETPYFYRITQLGIYDDWKLN